MANKNDFAKGKKWVKPRIEKIILKEVYNQGSFCVKTFGGVGEGSSACSFTIPPAKS